MNELQIRLSLTAVLVVILAAAGWSADRFPAESSRVLVFSKTAELLANEQARAVLEKHVPGMTTHPQLQQALQMSLREIAPYAPDVYTEQVLEAIEKDLAGLNGGRP